MSNPLSKLEGWQRAIRDMTSRVPPPQLYCLGFVFSEDGSKVVMIRKNRPEWQVGKWNGVGGKVEPGEIPINAMVREFREEAGLWLHEERWTERGQLYGQGYIVHVYSGRLQHQEIVMSNTDELVYMHDSAYDHPDYLQHVGVVLALLGAKVGPDDQVPYFQLYY